MSTVPGRLVARPAAAALAALLASTLLAACGSEEPADAGSGGSQASATPTDGATTPGDSGDGASAGPVSSKDWRTEVWHDLQLKVPADWAVGYAPVTDGKDVLECAVGPLGSDSQPDTSTPYVGRPGFGSDACDGTGDVDVPEQDFVWFGSPLDRGEDEESGRTVTTVDIGGERVTVGAAPDVAKAILRSLEEVTGEDANGCLAKPTPETRYPAEGFGKNLAMSVCVYDSSGGGGTPRLWTERLGAEEANRLVRGVALSRRADCDPAQGRSEGQTVMLRVDVGNDFGSKTLIRDYSVELGECPVALDLSESVIGPPRPVGLNERILDAFAGEGVQAYVGAGSVPAELQPYFKPMMG
jgi:hypothetical protein